MRGLASAKKLRLSGTIIDDESIEKLSQCRLETLILEIERARHAQMLHHILQGEIRKNLRKLRVLRAEDLDADDIQVLAMLESLEEIELGKEIASSEYLHAISENSGVIAVLRRAKLKMQTWRPNDETVELLCGMEVDWLSIRGTSTRTAALLFSNAAGSRLAERLRTLSLGIYEQVPGTIGTMPFTKLEQSSLCVSDEVCVDGLETLLETHPGPNQHTLCWEAESRQRWGACACVRLVNLAELILEYSKLMRGTLQRMLGGQTKLRKLVMCTSETGITVEDVQTVMAIESLSILNISDNGTDTEGIIALVGTENSCRESRDLWCVLV